MSKLFGMGRRASEYVRRRMSRSVQSADRQIAETQGSRRQATSLTKRLADFILGQANQRYPTRPPGNEPRRSGAPPQTPGQPPAPPRSPVGGADEEEEYDDIQLLGRDATYHEDDWRVVMDQERLTPGSSNVHGYYFEFESRTSGILYVTFLSNGENSGPGPTYAYYNVSGRRYHEFRRATDSSAGKAVWDYLRVRGSAHSHQVPYRLVGSSTGYIPRKATSRGFAARALADRGTGRRSYRRNTLPGYNEPNRGRPDRGEPNRGEPNRGR